MATQTGGRAGRRFRSTLAGLIFRTFRVEQAEQQRSGGGFSGSFKDIFSGMFNGGKQAARGPQPGTDLEYQVSVDFWTAVRGGVTRLEIQRQEICPTCKGKSTTGGSVECPECHGSGQVTQMGGRMKFNIQCPRCGGTGKVQNDVPDVRWRRRGDRSGSRWSFGSSRGLGMGRGFGWRGRAMPGRMAGLRGICI